MAPLDDRFDTARLFTLAATAERYSEHPLAEAVRAAAVARELSLGEPETFEALPGTGVRVRIHGDVIGVSNRRLLDDAAPPIAAELETQGKKLLFVTRTDRRGRGHGHVRCLDDDWASLTNEIQ